MIKYQNIKDVHLEISTVCNARCPMCSRNAFGYPHNFGYPETSMTLSQFQQIFVCEFLQQLETLQICGNFGDFVANPHSLDIVEYAKITNPSLKIFVTTNGGARNKEFWTRLGVLNVEIIFCLDGLADTHALYRLDTDWNTVIKNAEYFISAGGIATWKMIEFDHNQHQIESCRELSTKLGFTNFILSNHGRTQSYVYNRQGLHIGTIGNHVAKTAPAIQIMVQSIHQNQDLVLPQEKTDFNCYSRNKQSIYVSADGSVYPCCFMGFYPKTYRRESLRNFQNEQITNLLSKKNNQSLDVGIESAITWFEQIEQAWNKSLYTQGRLVVCDHHCGQNKYRDNFSN